MKKILKSLFIIYLFNRMAILIDIFIPINIFTVITVYLLEIPGLLLLIILKLII